jgi:hypothetical protein
MGFLLLLKFDDMKLELFLIDMLVRKYIKNDSSSLKNWAVCKKLCRKIDTSHANFVFYLMMQCNSCHQLLWKSICFHFGFCLRGTEDSSMHT